MFQEFYFFNDDTPLVLLQTPWICSESKYDPEMKKHFYYVIIFYELWIQMIIIITTIKCHRVQVIDKSNERYVRIIPTFTINPS